MSAFRKSHWLFERSEWSESLCGGRSCACPVLPIALHKATLPLTPQCRPPHHAENRLPQTEAAGTSVPSGHKAEIRPISANSGFLILHSAAFPARQTARKRMAARQQNPPKFSKNPHLRAYATTPLSRHPAPQRHRQPDRRQRPPVFRAHQRILQTDVTPPRFLFPR